MPQITLTFKKSTKNTYVFESNEEGAIIPTLYVNKSAFAKQPTTITVTVEEN